MCLALRYFASGQFMYSIGDAEHLSKNTVCRMIHKVVLALSKLLDAFVVFPGHLSALQIKEGFYAIAGITHIKIGQMYFHKGKVRLITNNFL